MQNIIEKRTQNNVDNKQELQKKLWNAIYDQNDTQNEEKVFYYFYLILN